MRTFTEALVAFAHEVGCNDAVEEMEIVLNRPNFVRFAWELRKDFYQFTGQKFVNGFSHDVQNAPSLEDSQIMVDLQCCRVTLRAKDPKVTLKSSEAENNDEYRL